MSTVKPPRFTRCAALIAGAIAALLPFAVHADNWPSKPIKLVVPYPPGGAADAVGRVVAEKLSESLKQSVIVENKPGAGTAIAAEYVAKSPADGYTLAIAPTGQLTILPHVQKTGRLEPLTAFTPISQLAYTAVAIAAAPNFPAATLKDAVALAKAKPGDVSFSSSGSTTIIHLAGEYFAEEAGVKLLHVPFKGSAPAVTALLGGEVNLAFDTLTVLAPQIKAGKVKGLAIAAKDRSPLLPDVPTVAEQGYPGFEVPSWFGLVGPAGLPKDIVKRLNGEVAAILAQPAVKERLASQALQAWPSTPEQFAQRIRDDYAKYGKVVKQAGITLE
ncbi:tripartite tricarboxylate transporter substrate binding protein [Rhodocyclus tenuis]|uniref:Tripartite tricarboxylate transporter substrate binding protein n=2 Tax=Rhodocyclus TaxID=1064 RepID=A0A6L5K1J1_RHOTE|nr:tripartite tricarboxylate transporter substrate binding protein [Rhodocyclus gracilis]MQY52378.1 tripartite tricarboxylate transporter substrate binding protein [Rhodocyclus gracilis]NJA90212.1 tripartite tricarboxylate transporter substrate binding protein [Rhodocyclus gracilis]